MPKYSYTAEGAKALWRRVDQRGTLKCKRWWRVWKATRGVLLHFFTSGENDVLTILDLPENLTAGALSLAVTSTGQFERK